MPAHPLEPDRAAMEAMAAAATGVVTAFVEGLPGAPAAGTEGAGPLVGPLLAPPPEGPGDVTALLDRFRQAAAPAIETAGPGYLAYVGGGGLYSSALAEFVARAFNRYTGLAAFAPALVAMEEGTLRWLAGEMGLPGGSAGIVSTGGSLATLTALVAARVDRLGDDIGTGTVYVTEYTHRCVAKAARVAGLRPDQVRVVRSGPDLRIDPAAAAAMIEVDRAAGRRPFLLVGTAGTTHTGTVDPLGDLAVVAREAGVWFHVDGAYGGLFRLTARGRARLAGIEEADSVVLDPHKSLFLPHGTGVALVRDGATLRRAFAADGHYLQDVAGDEALPDYAELGPELTRDFRGLRLWLPLHLHGVAAFRDALDEKLDLAAYAHGELAGSGGLELPWAPDLSIVAFRLPGGEAANGANQALLARVNAGRRVHISSTLVGGVVTLRLCIISHRTHHDRVAEAVEVIVREAAAVPRP
jgi:aromatic-L-amino-acid decarboxylase